MWRLGLACHKRVDALLALMGFCACQLLRTITFPKAIAVEDPDATVC